MGRNKGCCKRADLATFRDEVFVVEFEDRPFEDGPLLELFRRFDPLALDDEEVRDRARSSAVVLKPCVAVRLETRYSFVFSTRTGPPADWLLVMAGKARP